MQPNIHATNREVLVKKLIQFEIELKNKGDILISDNPFLTIICPICRQIYKFTGYEEIPINSVKCFCGHMIIEYEQEPKPVSLEELI